MTSASPTWSAERGVGDGPGVAPVLRALRMRRSCVRAPHRAGGEGGASAPALRARGGASQPGEGPGAEVERILANLGRRADGLGRPLRTVENPPPPGPPPPGSSPTAPLARHCAGFPPSLFQQTQSSAQPPRHARRPATPRARQRTGSSTTGSWSTRPADRDPSSARPEKSPRPRPSTDAPPAPEGRQAIRGETETEGPELQGLLRPLGGHSRRNLGRRLGP